MEDSQGTPEESSYEFATRVGILFDNTGLLNRALIHRSYLNEHPEVLEDNERLEFLGDAVLDFLVGAWLYNRFPEMAEGQLTRLRAALVGNTQLAEFARDLKINRAIKLGRGEEEGGGRNRPALLGSMFEALIGAIYLDKGIQEVQPFVEPILEKAVQTILSNRKDQDPKSLLQEWSQAKGFGPPLYRMVSASGPDHEREFIVEVEINGQIYGKGSGRSKQVAAKNAANATLEFLEII